VSFGDSIKGTAEFSYISIGLGMAGFSARRDQHSPARHRQDRARIIGRAVIALILGNLRRTGGLNWTIPLSANLVLRNLRGRLFLAEVGMASGPKFAATVTQTGLLMLGLGAIVLFALVLPIFLLGLFLFRMPYDEVAGIVAGACGNPAILAYANKLAPTDRPHIGYAMIFPGLTILKILFVDIAPPLF
jgi:putative transport protein